MKIKLNNKEKQYILNQFALIYVQECEAKYYLPISLIENKPNSSDISDPLVAHNAYQFISDIHRKVDGNITAIVQSLNGYPYYVDSVFRAYEN